MLGFSFKGRHSSTLNIGVRSIDRTLIPAKRNSEVTVAGKHGSISTQKDIYEKRQIQMHVGLINNPDWVDLRTNAREVASWLCGTGQLLFDDEPDKYYIATMYDAVGLEQMHLQPIGTTEITFDCQPLAYGLSRSIPITNGANINNAGTFETKGTIRIAITEATNYLEVTLHTTGESLYLEDVFIVGDIVVIDLEQELVTKNGTSLMSKLHLVSDFFSIPPGTFKMGVSSGQATLDYIERWL